MKEISMNHLPAPTWNWLHVNDRKTALPEDARQAIFVTVNLPEEVQVLGGPVYLREHDQTNEELMTELKLHDVEMSAGEALDNYVKNLSVNTAVYQVADGVKVSEPLRITYDYTIQEEMSSVSRTAIKLGKDSELTVVCLMKGNGGCGINDTRIQAAEGSKLNLIRIYQIEDRQHLISTIGGSYEDASGLNLIEVVTGGGDLTLGCTAHLNGKRSYIDIDTGYYVERDGVLDVNYAVRHRGCDTNSKIVVNGALKDRAAKNFRGTIDFIKGCKGAKGDEREDILLIDDKVHNRTVPLILCAEEDVEGGHGASIGKLSDEVRFYFQSRGISEEEIVDLMAHARIDAVAGRIPDEVTRKLILNTEE